MPNRILLPVVSPVSKRHQTLAGGTASSKGIKQKLASELGEIAIDEKSIAKVADAIAGLLDGFSAHMSRLPTLKMEEFTVSLAVTSSGSLGFLGTGVEVEAEAAFEVTFRILER